MDGIVIVGILWMILLAVKFVRLSLAVRYSKKDHGPRETWAQSNTRYRSRRRRDYC